MTRIPNAHSLYLRLLALALVAALSFSATATEQEDPVVGQQKVDFDIKKKKAPAKPVPEKSLLEKLVGDFGRKDKLDWDQAYEDDIRNRLSQAENMALAVAGKVKRSDLDAEMKHYGEGSHLAMNLDVGRHLLLKRLFAEAMVKTNEQIGERQPLNRILTINSGSTGNAKRDQDITVDGGSALQEELLFKNLEKLARGKPYNLEVEPKENGGLSIGQLEVELHPRGNDLPDARVTTKVDAHNKKYTRSMQKQGADGEAYWGGGMERIVSERTQSQALVQEFTLSNGKVSYTGHTAKNAQQVRSLINGPPEVQMQKWKLASSMVNNALKGQDRTLASDPDLTKGPLKYATRTLKDLTDFYGTAPWVKLTPDDKADLLHRVFPHFNPKNAEGRKRLDKVVQALDTARAMRINESTLPAKGTAGVMDNHKVASEICAIFMRKAVVATASEMGRAMLDPPAFDFKKTNLASGELKAFRRMSAWDQHQFMVKKDADFRKMVSHQAMENLLMTMVQWAKLDQDPRMPKRVKMGSETMRMIQAQAPQELRAVVDIASQYAKVYVASKSAKTPDQCIDQIQKLYDLRNELKQHLGGQEAPGKTLIRKMAKVKPHVYLKNEAAGRPSLMGRQALETSARFRSHLEQRFPKLARDFQNFKAELDTIGPKNYVKRRIAQEMMQLDTAADLLTTLEMMQDGASAGDIGTFWLTNFISTAHWSVSPVISAFQVQSQEDVENLGKNVVFTLMTRYLPGGAWAATAKIGFDIAKGAVSVTAGYVIKGENAETIDQLYTGETVLGPVDQVNIRGGTKANAIREAFNVLSGDHFQTVKDRTTGKENRVLNRAQIYADFFQTWTGTEWADLPHKPKKDAETMAFTQAHDEFVTLLIRQAEQNQPLWVKDYHATPTHHSLDPTDDEFKGTMEAIYPMIEALCRSYVVKEVLDKVGTGQFMSGGKDMIEEGLVKRFAADFFAGMIEAWENQITQQMLAVREINQAAMNADLAAMARVIHEKNYPKKPKKKPRPKNLKLDIDVHAATDPVSLTGPDITVDVSGIAKSVVANMKMGSGDADGGGVIEEEEHPKQIYTDLDGSAPITFEPILSGYGDIEGLGEVIVEVAEEIIQPWSQAIAEEMGDTWEAPEGDEDGGLGDGDLARSTVTFVAKIDGQEVDRQTVVYDVRLPAAEDEGPGSTLPIRKHTEGPDFMDKADKEYTYIDAAFGFGTEPPEGWKTSFMHRGILHGDFITTYREDSFDAKAGEKRVMPYNFGNKHGVAKCFNAKGKVIKTETWVNDQLHGPSTQHYNPKDHFQVRKNIRAERVYENGHLIKQEVFNTADRKLEIVTANLIPPEDTYDRYEGDVTAYYPNGKVKIAGSYKNSKDTYSETCPGWGWFGDNQFDIARHGQWTTYYDSSQVKQQMRYQAGKLEGPYKWQAANGTVMVEGAYRQGKRVGAWTFRYPSGNPRAQGSYTDGDARGPWVVYLADSKTAQTWEMDLTSENYYSNKRWLSDIEPDEEDEADDIR